MVINEILVQNDNYEKNNIYEDKYYFIEEKVEKRINELINLFDGELVNITWLENSYDIFKKLSCIITMKVNKEKYNKYYEEDINESN